MKTTCVNKRTRFWDVYIGRPSDFGNPFVIDRDGDREQVIAKYREWFENRIQNDPEFRSAIEALKGKRLACFCKPLACHGDVIVEYLEASK